MPSELSWVFSFYAITSSFKTVDNNLHGFHTHVTRDPWTLALCLMTAVDMIIQILTPEIWQMHQMTTNIPLPN